MTQRSGSTDEKLESWKEIAAFLGRGVRTVQRWERTEDLPVRRHQHERGGTVYAYKSELLEWYQGRQSRLEAEAPHVEVETAQGPRRQSPIMPIGAGVAAVVILLLLLVLPTRSRQFAGPSTTLLSVTGRASQAVLSADGQRIAFAWNGEREFGNLDVYVKEVASGAPRRLTDDSNNEHSPSWSSDARSLVFLRDNAGVFLLNTGGGRASMLVPQQAGAVYGVGTSWSADGKHLYYSERSSAGRPLEIFHLNVSSRNADRVTSVPEGQGDMYPSLSPDGRYLAFVHQAKTLASDVQVIGLGPDGTAVAQRQPLTTAGSRIAGLDWTSDGRGIVFSSDHSGRRRLWMIRRGWLGWKSSAEPLAFAGEDAFQPSVSGPSLAYSRRYWPTAIWKVDLRGKEPPANPVKIVASAREDLEPAWSSDGRRLAFVSTRTGHTEIWTSQADGSGAVQLTHFSGPLTHKPVWSPDGRTIAFHSGPERSSSVFLVPRTGGKPVRLTTSGMHSNEPAWSPDGKRIYFTSNQGGSDRIWSVSVDGGEPSPVTAGAAGQPQLSADGAWLYFRRGGIMRVPAGGGPERSVVQAPVGTFAVGADGIYFDRGFGDYVPPELHFYDFKTAETRLLMQFERRKSAGLALSPDGRSILVPLNDRQSSEIMLVRE